MAILVCSLIRRVNLSFQWFYTHHTTRTTVLLTILHIAILIILKRVLNIYTSCSIFHCHAITDSMGWASKKLRWVSYNMYSTCITECPSLRKMIFFGMDLRECVIHRHIHYHRRFSVQASVDVSPERRCVDLMYYLCKYSHTMTI